MEPEHPEAFCKRFGVKMDYFTNEQVNEKGVGVARRVDRFC